MSLKKKESVTSGLPVLAEWAQRLSGPRFLLFLYLHDYIGFHAFHECRDLLSRDFNAS